MVASRSIRDHEVAAISVFPRELFIHWVSVVAVFLGSCGSTCPQATATVAAEHPTTPAHATREPAPARSENESTGLLLEAWDADASGLYYQLMFGPCAEDECPWNVRLVRGRSVLGTQSLLWPSAEALPGRVAIEALDATGDPIDERGSLGWSSGEENRSVWVIPTRVRLPEMSGLLISQCGGMEHVHCHAELFAVTDGNLARVWTEEPNMAAPEWPMIDVMDVDADEVDEIVVWRFFASDMATTDSWSRRVFAWNPEAQQLAESEALNNNLPLIVLVAGPVQPLGNAESYRMFGCLSSAGLHAVRASALDLSGLRGPVWVGWSSHQTSIDLGRARIRACSPSIAARAHTLRARSGSTGS